jgi:hypothetical protein
MKKQLALLRKLGAPPELIASFIEVCDINSRMPDDMRADFSTLLEN